MLCLAVLASWRGGDAFAGTPCKFSKGLAGYGASGNTSALIANGAVAVTTPAVYKTLYSVDVGIWVDADLAALDPNIPQLALTYYEHANCIYALGLNENTNLGVHNMSFRIAGNQIHFFARTSPKIPGTGAYWVQQTHQDWKAAIQALGAAAPKVNLLFTASSYVDIVTNSDGSIGWVAIGGASNGVGQGQALAAVDPTAYQDGAKPFNEDWWGVIAAHELGHALGVNGHLATNFYTMCCAPPAGYTTEPGNTESYKFSLAQVSWDTISANNAATGDNYADPYATVPNPVTGVTWSFPQVHQFLVPYNFQDATIWSYTGTPCTSTSCPGWQALDDSVGIAATVAANGNVYKLQNSGAIWRYTGTPCSGITCTGWQLVDNNGLTTAIAAGGNDLYQLHSDGAIWRYTGTPCSSTGCPGWQQLDHNPAATAIAAGGSSLYQLHGDGTIWRYTGTPCSGGGCPGWQKIGNTLGTLVASDSNLYQLRSNRSIWHFTGIPCSGTSCSGWEELDQNGSTTAITAAGGLYQLHGDGAIWRYTGTPCTASGCPGWQLVDNNPAANSIAAGGSDLFELHADGEIWRYTGTPCTASGCPGWQMLDHNASIESILAGPGLYQVHAN